MFVLLNSITHFCHKIAKNYETRKRQRRTMSTRNVFSFALLAILILVSVSAKDDDNPDGSRLTGNASFRLKERHFATSYL